MAINKESNVYTIVFATIMVVVVGGVLAFLSLSLKDKQEANGRVKKKIEIFKPTIEGSNAIKEELESFAQSIVNDTVPIVSIEDGVYALQVAHQIMDKLKLNGNLIQENI